MSDKRVLVTGAGGFIGRWSIPPLLQAGYDVHAVSSRSDGRAMPPALQGARLHGIRLHRADLLDAAAVEVLLREVRPSHLLHFAWISTPGVYWNSAENERWLEAGRHLLNCFRSFGGRRVVMAGTCAEYDWSQAGVCVERETPLARDTAGITRYAAAKLEMQRSLHAFGLSSGISTAWGRIFFQYGPDEHPERLVASVIGHLLRGNPAPCSHGRQVRSFLHAADVGAAFAALLDSSVEGPVNVGSDQRVSLADLLGRLAAQIGRPELVLLGARPAAATEPALLVPDVTRLCDEVGWRPRFDLDAGLADTVAWWRAKLSADLAALG